MSIRHQTIRHSKWLLAVTVGLGAMTAIPAIAQTHFTSINGSLISQVNQPYDQGVPSELYRDVSGVVVSLNGDQVVIESGNGQKQTYKIPVVVQRRYNLAPGSKITVTVDASKSVVDVSSP